MTDGTISQDHHWPRGTEVVALYSFRANSHEDLPFKRGETLIIVKETRDPMWYLAKKATDDKTGIWKVTVTQALVSC